MKLDLNQLMFVNPILREMALSIEGHYGVEFKITSLYRIDDSGVHGQLPLRGIDLSCPDADFGDLIESYVNSIYQYDTNRPSKRCAIYHDAGSGYHIHLQVHPNTRLK